VVSEGQIMKSMHRSRFLILLMLLLASLAQPSIAGTSLVRGRLERIAPNGQAFPAQGITVTVFNSQLGRSNPSNSGPDGLYYLYNIPPGPYTLEIWVSNPPMVFQIQVLDQPNTDIAPIRVP
jgi:hypothetical protein